VAITKATASLINLFFSSVSFARVMLGCEPSVGGGGTQTDTQVI
jgi:hypothetical protein